MLYLYILWYESTCSFPGAIITDSPFMCMRSVALSNHLCLSVCLSVCQSVNLSMADGKISIYQGTRLRVNLHMLTWYTPAENTLGRCSSYLWKLFVYITNAINRPQNVTLSLWAFGCLDRQEEGDYFTQQGRIKHEQNWCYTKLMQDQYQQ